jgi:hypothetical protein
MWTTTPFRHGLRASLLVLASTVVGGCDMVTGPAPAAPDAQFSLGRAATPSGIPFRRMANMESITFFERTGESFPNAHTFTKDDHRLLSRIGSALTSANAEFVGVVNQEFFDVFYSDAQGNADPDGQFVTIEATFDNEMDSALNIAAVQVNFANRPPILFNRVASFAALGSTAIPATVQNAVDGNFLTHTYLGHTISGSGQRLRLTLGVDNGGLRIQGS